MGGSSFSGDPILRPLREPVSHVMQDEEWVTPNTLYFADPDARRWQYQSDHGVMYAEDEPSDSKC